ncbi:succinate semialdehyde dehydrogenase NADP+ linked [Acarospora aff. strigata]|nr:succinate semialdehyde dehydrogenase NADP+ linked [Acarospora aff. strigata]
MPEHSVPKLNDQSLFKQGECYVNGEWIKAKSGKTFEVTDPSSGKVIGSCPEFDKSDTENAIKVAEAAFKDFRKTLGRERSRMLRKWYQLMVDNAEDLAKLITWENGKPLADAKGEVTYAANFFEWFSEEAPRTYGDTIPASIPGSRVFTIKEPVGVCGLITPWNFPAAMITRKIGPALAAGCTVVAKSPGETPFTSLAIAELAHRAGIPKGVVNFITALENTAEVGEALTSSPTVRKVSFTGSTGVGKLLMKQSADTLKKLSFELGGNAPFIIFDDADLDAAVTGAITSKFRSSGQTCVCANRIYVQKGIYDEFAQKFTEKVKAFKVGGGYDEGVTHGPLIHDRAIGKVAEHVKDAESKGAKVVQGGHKMEKLGSNFFEPTVITGMTMDMRIASEETFGPVAALFPFDTEKDVVEMANKADVGLAGYFFSRDLQRVYRVAEALETGMVGVNTGLISDPAAPFGGVKYSGFGREGSKYGIEEYQITKMITLGGMGAASRASRDNNQRQTPRNLHLEHLKVMKRDGSPIISDTTLSTRQDWDDEPPTSLAAPISPPPLDDARYLKRTKVEKKQDLLTLKSPTLAAIEAGEAQIRDHLAYFSKHLSKVIRPCLPDVPRLSISDFVKLYERNSHAQGHHFVIHQHDHPVAGVHYDLRLQFSESSSISFAIMYGIPGNPNSLRMGRNATETRVHNLWNHLIESASHATGSLLIWDTGEYSILPSSKDKTKPSSSCSDSNNDSPCAIAQAVVSENEKLHQAFQTGKIRLRLHGTRLPHNYTIVLRLTGLNYRSDLPPNPLRVRKKRRRTRPQNNPSANSSTRSTPPSSSPDSDPTPTPPRTQRTPDTDFVVTTMSPARPPGVRPSATDLEPDIAPQEQEQEDEDEDQRIHRTNAYPGATNTINSIHQRSWHLSLDKPSCGFVRRNAEPNARNGGGKKIWVRERDHDDMRGGFETFFVRGRDVERSVVTGRSADEVLADEGVQGYVARKGWTAVLE